MGAPPGASLQELMVVEPADGTLEAVLQAALLINTLAWMPYTSSASRISFVSLTVM